MLDLDRPPSAIRATIPATADDRAEPAAPDHPQDESPWITPATRSAAPHARHVRHGHPHSHRRHVPSTLSLRRLLVVSALVLLLPAILIVAVLLDKQPDPPPAETAPAFSALTQIPDNILQAQLDRSQKVARLTEKLTGPTLLSAAETGSTDPGALPTLAVTPRAVPYTLAELRGLVPAAFTELGTDTGVDGPVLLTANLQVPLDATVVIDTQTSDVRLSSTPSGFATIISRGTVEIVGDAGTQVRISSWDPDRGRVDGDSSDGRSFIAQIGGRMDVTHAVLGYLGFNLGLSSGVAWSGASASTSHPEPVAARGTVSSSLFVHNYFGAYTRDADGMVWTGNIFADNEQYGLDPHDFSNNFIVAGNVSYQNGKHGFIFSRGCTHNLLVGNIAYGNGGHGFMIDDGRSLSTDTAQTRINGSDDNVLLHNSSSANAGSGVEIEGGTGNTVDGNQSSGNYVGVRIKDGASASVRGNTLADNIRYGVDVRDGDGVVDVTGNTISGSWGAVSLATDASATLDANSTDDVSASLVVAGAAVRETTWFDSVAAVLRWNPMLMLWSVVLGVPIIVAVARFSMAAARNRRRRNPVA